MLLAVAICALNFRPIVRSRPIVAQLSDAASDNWANLKNMPPKLAEWGCTDELWAIARNKKRLVQWAEEGDAVAEQKARDRLELLRTAPKEELTPTLREWGCDEALWNKIRNRRALVEWAEAGEEAKVKERLEKIRSAASASTLLDAKKGPYKRAGDLEAKVDTEAIEKLMIERAKAKSKRDYEAADKIRDELRSVHNIDIFDKQRIWKLRDGAAREQRAAARREAEDKLEMPALLGEWGCDDELWKAVVSKSALIKLVEKGSEEYGRKRIARMRELVAAGGDDA